MFRQLSTNSAIYGVTSILQKGLTFLLMPLYTLYLDPTAFGVLAIVTAVNGFLSIAFTLGLTGAVTRFYFEYQDQPLVLAEFWGTVLSAVILSTLALGGLLLLVGNHLLSPFIGSVEFWPYVALGVLTTFFQPFFITILAVLQARNEARRYALLSIANFLLTTALTIALVVFLRKGVVGALVATLLSSVVFFFASAFLMRKDVRVCLRWHHLREALSYSLPLVPHSLAGQTTAMSDRMIVNAKLGTAFAGLYSVGAMIAMAVEVAAIGVNKAYFPLSMQAMKSGKPEEFAQMRVIGAMVVAGFCTLGASLGAFAPELVRLLTAPTFAPAARVVPILVFSGVASAIYYLLVNALFFDRAASRLIPIGTLGGAGMSIGFAFLLIPPFGMMGAAVGNLLAQTFATVAIAVLARRFEPVAWDYTRYCIAFVCGLACSLAAARIETGMLLATLALKLLALFLLTLLLGLILWRLPLILPSAVYRVVRGRPAEAAALLRQL